MNTMKLPIYLRKYLSKKELHLKQWSIIMQRITTFFNQNPQYLNDTVRMDIVRNYYEKEHSHINQRFFYSSTYLKAWCIYKGYTYNPVKKRTHNERIIRMTDTGSREFFFIQTK